MKLSCVFYLKLFALIFITISANYIQSYDTESSAVIKTKHSAVIAGETVLFEWENVEKFDIDPKITFWDYDSSPFLDKNFIEGSWSYLNEQSILNSSISNPNGQVLVKAPKEEGLYKIYYCYTRYREFKCNFIRNLAVISCGSKNFKKMKDILENKKQIKSSGTNTTENVEIQDKNKTTSESLNKTNQTVNEKFKNNKNKINEIDFKQSFVKQKLAKESFDSLSNNKSKANADSKKEKEKEKTLTQSNIEHVIIFISENHSFDSIFGRYCRAETNSNPTCNSGPDCCEAAPSEIHGIKPFTLTDTQNSRHDPCHQSSCENSEINGGLMNKYLLNGVGSHPYNFAVASDSLFSAKNYFNFARNGAICDNFFQSSSGASDQNNMYFAAAKFLFLDNKHIPQSRELNGAKCFKEGDESFKSFDDPTIADLLNVCGVSWTFYAEGFNENPNSDQCYPYFYDASDDPFTYFPSLTQSPTAAYNFRDYEDLKNDIVSGSLPAVSYIKALGIHSEHPEYAGSFLTGQLMSNEIWELLKNSQYYKENTILFLLPDESGGFFDHKKPPPVNQIDGYPYGPRTHFVALGEMVKKNYVSHVLMESSSLIRFIEWNWLGKEGLLWGRDLVVNNIGDIIDEEKAGVIVPSINRKSVKDIEKSFNKRKEKIKNNAETISRFVSFRKNKNELFISAESLNNSQSPIVSSSNNNALEGLVRIHNSNLRKRMKFSNSRQKRFEDS